MAATLLPSAPRSVSARTETGTMALSVSSSVGKPRSRSQRPSASETTLSTTSLIVPPRTFLIALKRSSSASTQSKRRWGEIDTFSGVLGARVDAARGQRPDGGGVVDHAAQHPAWPAEHRTRAAHDLGRQGGALDQRLAQQLGVAGQRPRHPRALGRRGRRCIGRRVEQHGGDVHARRCRPRGRGGSWPAARSGRPRACPRARSPTAASSRSSCCENTRPARFFSCCLGARARQRRVAHVVARVEVRIVDPDRPALAERHGGQALAVAGDEVQTALDRPEELVVGRDLALEDHHRGDVHVSRRCASRCRKVASSAVRRSGLAMSVDSGHPVVAPQAILRV